MQRLYFILGLLIGLLGLTACNHANYYHSRINQDLLQENWIRAINTDPRNWTTTADNWFFTGRPNRTERYALAAPISNSMTILAVRVADFTKVNIDGNIQVQIIGNQDHNSVYVLGPNDETRQVAVSVTGDSLNIHQAAIDGKTPCLHHVIVRIGIHNLRCLNYTNDAIITGRDIVSDNLSIVSAGNGRVLLEGNINLTQVTETGKATVTVIGAYTPCLHLNVNGDGNLNISGRVGVQDIYHNGNGTINIIGADSDSLTINAAGHGCIAISGYVNLKRISARDFSHVYLYWVNSNEILIQAQDHALVGLAGKTCVLHVGLVGNARFGGQYLRGENVYVQTRDEAHATVTAKAKLYALSLNNSSIYYYGSAQIASPNTGYRGSVISVWDTPPPNGMPACPSRCEIGVRHRVVRW